MSDLTHAEIEAMRPAVMKRLAEAESAKRQQDAMQMARQDALEEIERGYRALSAVIDLLLLGGSIPGQGPRPPLEMVTCDDMHALLTLVARSIGGPLERTGFALE